MTTSRLMAGASRFAHFAGLARPSTRAAQGDDDTTENSRAEDDEDGAHAEEDGHDEDQPKGKKGKKSKASEEDDDEAEPKGKKSKRAAEDDGDGDDDEDAEPKSKGKKSRRAAEDDDDEDAEDDDDKREMTGNSAAASARRRERARCSAIFASPHAAANVALAASLAFETTMTRQEALVVLKGQAGRSAPPVSRSTREARNTDLGAPAGEIGSKPKAGSGWDRTFMKIGVVKPKA